MFEILSRLFRAFGAAKAHDDSLRAGSHDVSFGAWRALVPK
jgi:hypothetical protein